MANEILPTNRGYVLIKEESTYGTDPTHAATDVRRVVNWESQAKDLTQPREALSPYRGGLRNIRVGGEFTFSGETPLTIFDVPTTDAGNPVEDPFLIMCGFTRAWATGPPDTQTYTCKSQGHGSVCIEEYFFDEDLADGVAWQYLGCRADWSIDFAPGTPTMLKFTGEGKSATQLASPTPAAITYSSDCDIVGDTWVVVLTELDGDSAFGGGVIEGSLTGNMGLVRQGGLDGTVGPAFIRLVPQTGVGLSLVVEQVADGDWDPTTMLADCDGSQGMMTVTLTSTNTNIVVISLTCSISDLEIISDQDGRRAWRLNHTGAWPEDTSDGGGLKPADNLTITYKNDEA
jgi:hypothetical protein